MKQNLPNLLTLLRLLGVLAICGFLSLSGEKAFILAFWIFIFASSTDWLDGFLARRWKTTSDFGIVFDSLVDKALILGTMIFLIPYNFIPIWLWGVIFFREILIDGIKNYSLSRGIAISANKFGKLKLTTQVVLLGSCLMTLAYPHIVIAKIYFITLAIITIILAYLSAIPYGKAFIHSIRKK